MLREGEGEGVLLDSSCSLPTKTKKVVRRAEMMDLEQGEHSSPTPHEHTLLEANWGGGLVPEHPGGKATLSL